MSRSPDFPPGYEQRQNKYKLQYECPNCGFVQEVVFDKGIPAPKTLTKECGNCGCSPLDKVVQ